MDIVTDKGSPYGTVKTKMHDPNRTISKRIERSYYVSHFGVYSFVKPKRQSITITKRDAATLP